MTAAELHVLKGHGTGNDFVLVPDLAGELLLSDELVRALCDRHRGVGADGVLRIVRTENVPEFAELAEVAPFFMDYRNADGSIAEMCGNGVRVFAHYLRESGLIADRTAVATRGGVKPVRFAEDGVVTVEMGKPRLLSAIPVVTPFCGVGSNGRALEIPNPHVVVPVDDVQSLQGLDLGRAPAVVPALPHGQNVEFVTKAGERHLSMRVYERGVGETLSCGTGICAAVVAQPEATSDGQSWQVDVPGGTCWVRWRDDGEVELSGPAVLVARIALDSNWLDGLTR
jgi:diaminopimelate epimerase